MTTDDVMLYGKLYQWATSKMYNEIPVRMVACGCGADIDQYCMFRNGRGTTPHADRRTALQRHIKASDENRAEYEEMKQDLIRYYVDLAIQEIRKQAA